MFLPERYAKRFSDRAQPTQLFAFLPGSIGMLLWKLVRFQETRNLYMQTVCRSQVFENEGEEREARGQGSVNVAKIAILASGKRRLAKFELAFADLQSLDSRLKRRRWDSKPGSSPVFTRHPAPAFSESRLNDLPLVWQPMFQRADPQFGQSFLTRFCGQPTLLD